jgi:hydroxyacylglutathione hydrolase
MIVERAMDPDYLSNTYLVAAAEGGEAFFVDAGGPVQPLIEKAQELDLTPTHVLLTHRHGDHVQQLGELLERWPGLVVLAHPDERVPGTTGDLQPDEEVTAGGLTVRALHTPGHTAGMLALLVDGTDVFTGDTLFKGSVGGVRAPGSTGFHDLKSSIMDKLMKLPPETRLHPGHTDPTTVGDEWENNAFIRVWRGEDDESDDRCVVWGEDATLVLWGPDYDGGHKAWVRWDSSGKDDIVPGSQVERK